MPKAGQKVARPVKKILMGSETKALVALGKVNDDLTVTPEGFCLASVADNEYAKEAKLLSSTQAIIDETKNNPNAIGYVGLVLLIAKMCAFNDLVGCSGNCNQGRTQCDCQEARDA